MDEDDPTKDGDYIIGDGDNHYTILAFQWHQKSSQKDLNIITKIISGDHNSYE